MSRSLPKVLVVDDENEWLTKLSAILSRHRPCTVVGFGSYESADAYIGSDDSAELSEALIDVRLRGQIYDQGGLALLNLLKERYPELPVVVLTAYSYDYPGLRDITQRYRSVLTYDKEIFEKQPDPILSALFAELPPQIGEGGARSPLHPLPRSAASAAQPKAANSVGREIAAGALLVVFLLIAALLFFLLANAFTNYSWHLNIIFAVMMVAFIAVVLRVFTPKVVRQAVAIYREIAGMRPKMRATTTAPSNGSNGQNRRSISPGESEPPGPI